MLQLERKYFRNVKVLRELSYFKLSNALKTWSLKLTSRVHAFRRSGENEVIRSWFLFCTATWGLFFHVTFLQVFTSLFLVGDSMSTAILKGWFKSKSTFSCFYKYAKWHKDTKFQSSFSNQIISD